MHCSMETRYWVSSSVSSVRRFPPLSRQKASASRKDLPENNLYPELPTVRHSCDLACSLKENEPYIVLVKTSCELTCLEPHIQDNGLIRDGTIFRHSISDTCCSTSVISERVAVWYAITEEGALKQCTSCKRDICRVRSHRDVLQKVISSKEILSLGEVPAQTEPGFTFHPSTWAFCYFGFGMLWLRKISKMGSICAL